ncbi:hypothetical protein K435DRAFT_775024 [Dendrothele bispora CBS 962.96]|uniref:PH-domain-containing protein n=1 Tax=Dendrothele bispora (strain CBS 962.96) TaxID=1314807 RepID=A0A4S8MKJ0_DENBC|nr:hypothetical protein K435DRAFT_775024 [Dendrothele bispora CBS 962.96]
MPEYVYALHDFLPEHDDEVPFRTGERIEVIEKDDMYGDGWWQGRNTAGRVGLFPQSYTTSTPPVDNVATLNVTHSDTDVDDNHDEDGRSPHEEDIEGSAHPQPGQSGSQSQGQAQAAQADPPAIYINGASTSSPDGEMMRATMTDVQKAIEQLGRPRSNSVDEDKSLDYSFASSVHNTDTENENEREHEGGDDDTDTDFDMDEKDVDPAEWHKGARRRLAEKARKAVEEAEKLEAMMGMGMGGPGNRSSAPPIAVELSDESEGEEDELEDEGDFTKSSSYFRRHSRIPEEDEEDEDSTSRDQREEEHELTVPERDETEAQTATATRSTFGAATDTTATSNGTTEAEPVSNGRSLPTPVSPGFALSPSPSTSTVTATPTQATPVPPSPAPVAPAANTGAPPPMEQKIDSTTQISGLPSPTASSTASITPFQFNASQSGSSVPSSSLIGTPTPSIQDSKPTIASISPSVSDAATEPFKDKPPSDWTLPDVVAWLKSKSFDEDVCEKFAEQEITGDVLLELDVNVLKNEIGIMAFGKRVRIANAIAELKRPPSPMMPMTPINQQGFNMGSGLGQYSPQAFPTQSPHSGSFTQAHSRNQSQAHSHHSFPGSIVPGTPGGNGTAGSVKDSYSVHSAGGVIFVPNSAGGELTTSPLSGKRLSSSPSDSALGSRDGDGEEQGAVSEGEALSSMTNSASSKRRLFGRSHDSAASEGRKSSRNSKDGGEEAKEKEKEGGAPAPAPTARHRPRKSIDGGKGGENNRLSIFGSTFSGSLGKQKHRKPPPRYSTVGEDGAMDSDNADKAAASGSSFHLPKFSTGPRKSSGRPGSSSGLKSKEGDTPTKDRDQGLLRKRTSSYPGPSSAASHASRERKDKEKDKDKDKDKGNEKGETTNGHGEGADAGPQSPLKPGQSILDQIGEPDHSGWMRKKGDRYNSWKLRYFVLKGQHMYCLKSDSHAETKIKGYINIVGYKVTVDENVNPGKYGFRIDHDHDKTHFFSSDEKAVIRDWMKAIMKATIGRDYTKPVISSFNAPTIPLMVAQAMNPAPRPPSPTARDATQKAMRRENPNQLSSRDARVLMGLPGPDSKEERTRLDSFFSTQTVASDANKDPKDASTSPTSAAPPRPSREARRASVTHSIPSSSTTLTSDDSLFEWANGHLPSSLQINSSIEPVCGGLALLRLAEAIKGRPSSPPVPDSAFPRDLNDDKLEGFFRLFDFLLDNDVKMGSVSINDVRTGNREKIVQLLKALKAWEDKRRAIAQSIGKGSVQAGPFIAAGM